MKRKLFENVGGNQFRLVKEDDHNTSVSVRNRELPGSDDRDNEYRDTRDYDAEDRAKAKEDDDNAVDENVKTSSDKKTCRIKDCSAKVKSPPETQPGLGGLCSNHVDSQKERERKSGAHEKTIRWIRGDKS